MNRCAVARDGIQSGVDQPSGDAEVGPHGMLRDELSASIIYPFPVTSQLNNTTQNSPRQNYAVISPIPHDFLDQSRLRKKVDRASTPSRIRREELRSRSETSAKNRRQT